MGDYKIDPVAVNEVDTVICDIHAAAADATSWESVVNSIGRLFGSAYTTIARHQFASGRGEFIYLAPANERLSADYADRFSLRNPWFMASSEYSSGRVMYGEELVNQEILIKSDFYQQFMQPYGLLHQLCGVIARHPDCVYYLTLYRNSEQAPFELSNKQLLQRILPHLTLSLNNYWRLRCAEGWQHILFTVIEHFENAAFLVARDGVILHRNTKSDEFVQRCGGIAMRKGKIEAATALEQRALLTAINEVADATAEHLLDINKIMTLASSSDELPIIITLRPIGSMFSVETGNYQNIVILTARNPSDSPHPHSCSFSKLYELTPAQSRLSALMFSGYTLANAAKRLHVSENTIRSHLKQIYLKTNTHGQMELVQLHTRICNDHF